MNVGFIGTGNMGGMLIRSLIRAGAVRPGQVWAANRTPAKLERLAAEVPGIHAAPAAEVAAQCGIVFLCVKPGETNAALNQVDLGPGHLLVVLSNMLALGAMERRVPARLAKVIPTLTQQLGAGIALIMYGSRITPADRTLLETLLARISRPMVIDEALGRTCADITSCGPAFLAYVLRSMARAAVEVQPDLSPTVAEALVRETALATARLLVEGGMQFDEVMERIAVPGGITAEGLRVLEQRVPAAWRETFTATADLEEEKLSRLRL